MEVFSKEINPWGLDLQPSAKIKEAKLTPKAPAKTDSAPDAVDTAPMEEKSAPSSDNLSEAASQSTAEEVLDLDIMSELDDLFGNTPIHDTQPSMVDPESQNFANRQGFQYHRTGTVSSFSPHH